MKKILVLLLIFYLLLTSILVVYSNNHSTLSNKYRPIRGGIEINQWKFHYTSGYTLGNGCSIGYPAIVYGIRGYVTAGHCFNGQISGINWEGHVFQPSRFINNSYAGAPLIVDGDFYNTDSAFVEYYDVSSNLMTRVSGIWINAQITDYYSWNEIHFGNILFGLTIYKTGINTTVTSTYVYSYRSYLLKYEYDDGIWRLFKYIIYIPNLYAGKGDSGGPVYTLETYYLDGMLAGNASLVGIVIGKKGSDTMVISVDGIRYEIGISPIIGG